jgi:hypothetical protein
MERQESLKIIEFALYGFYGITFGPDKLCCAKKISDMAVGAILGVVGVQDDPELQEFVDNIRREAKADAAAYFARLRDNGISLDDPSCNCGMYAQMREELMQTMRCRTCDKLGINYLPDGPSHSVNIEHGGWCSLECFEADDAEVGADPRN